MKHAKHAKHSTPLRAIQVALVLLAALAASTAAHGAEAQTATPQAGPRTPAPAGPSYGPVLYPQATRSEPGAQPEQTPQAQEEKAGPAVQARPGEVDPSARPAPQPKEAARAGAGKDQKKRTRAKRRSVQQQVDSVPPVESRAPEPPRPPPLPPAQPVSLVPGPAQINSCVGSTCTDTNGATYNTGVGNAAVNGQGRLCTRSGNTMQCF